MVVIVLAVVLIPKLFVSPEKYMESSDYEKAYTTAKTESEKSKIVAEDAIAVCCNKCVDNLKTPSSFELKNAYYDTEYGWVVLEVVADNGSGENVMNYWLFSYTNKSKDYSYVDNFSDLEKEEESYYDSTDEKSKKLIRNVCKIIIKETEKADKMLSSEGVMRINKQFKEGTLKNVKLISGATYRTKEDSSSSSSYDFDD